MASQRVLIGAGSFGLAIALSACGNSPESGPGLAPQALMAPAAVATPARALAIEEGGAARSIVPSADTVRFPDDVTALAPTPTF